MQAVRPPFEPASIRMSRSRRSLLAVLIALPALGACSSEPDPSLEATHAQPAIGGIPAAHPAPLTEAEIAQYLQVMRAAAQRVQHPSDAERRVLAHADAITAAANRGDPQAGGDPAVLAQALSFRMQMDLQVATALHLDPARYQAVSERIEDEAGELYCDGAAPVPDPALKPHVAEIERLVGTVRNPGLVGSPPSLPACANGDAR